MLVPLMLLVLLTTSHNTFWLPLLHTEDMYSNYECDINYAIQKISTYAKGIVK